ncbi:MBL fold metallo-hydrolase [Deinococcus sp. HMF7604]|uniref:MBL fold metallo-hydrolase n=1 Tax=Deinococcus betulae TaxID=2873312 RepID=UPI001CCC5E6B|nr:MBL fold metallo-hydrolase [Deinococcus betulae]MBZ9753520.1 MBL fold metallo-hydrolase [Deinococcus betulae]
MSLFAFPPAFGGVQALREDVFRVRLPMVNVYFLGTPEGKEWVLVDAGLPGTAGLIERAAQQVYGDCPPQAIVLTHGHLDHVGALHALLKRWAVPVYNHSLELPFLTGQAAYPFPDPSVGGSMSLLSPVFLPGPFDFRPAVQPLSVEGAVPHLPAWRWLHTPGHASGHISLWRASDRTLIAGDAVVTTRQEWASSAVSMQPVVLRGPPAYYTPNWDAARRSVETLAGLDPELIATGHGHPLLDGDVPTELHRLARQFDQQVRPRRGWYLRHPVSVGVNRAGLDPLACLILGSLTLAALCFNFIRRR